MSNDDFRKLLAKNERNTEAFNFTNDDPEKLQDSPWRSKRVIFVDFAELEHFIQVLASFADAKLLIFP
jgi:hypothetical protein